MNTKPFGAGRPTERPLCTSTTNLAPVSHNGAVALALARGSIPVFPAHETAPPKLKKPTTTIEPIHADKDTGYVLLCEAFATGNVNFATGLLDQIAHVSRTGKDFTAREVNAMVTAIHQIGPRDPIEALLATQMIAVHTAAMLAARRLNRSETIDQHDSNSNAFNKLTRTFAAQVETLKRYRADGEQKVTVQHQHVTVSANQAVVGVSQRGGACHEKSNQSHAPSQSDERSAALLGQKQALGAPLPGPSAQRPAGVPHARSARRSPKR